MTGLAAPFPWFGGKRKVAPEVWAALGDPDNYIEPFAGSLAVLLAVTDYSVLAGSLGTPRPKPPCEPILKPVAEKPWTERAGKAAVKARSGGRCELGGPTCLLIAHDVDHVFGRRGPDPHNPDGLLHLCGFGNANGGCHQWVSQTRVGRQASIVVVEALR